jgi:LacI family transcriptional regulator
MKKSGSHPTTLADVASTAGVGIATASRAVNGGTNVSPGTLKRVQAAIRQLGYLPNHAARILKGGRTKTVGLLVPSIADSFFASCAEAAGEIARLHDSLLIVAVSNNDRDTEMGNLAALMRHRPDGLLIVPSDCAAKHLVSFVRSSALPIVTFDRPILGGGCASVLTDNFEAARTATVHLLEHGYKRILCLGGEPDLFTIRERLRGYRQVMEGAKLPLLIDTTLSGDANSAVSTLSRHLAGRRPPDAIFTLKNSATIAVFQALQRLKVSIPSGVALLGFDDFELASTLRPAISVVQQPLENVGRKAAELLFAQLDRTPGSLPSSKLSLEPIVFANRLVLRSSCGCKMRARNL